MPSETDDSAPKHRHGFNHGTIDTNGGNGFDYGSILNAGSAGVFCADGSIYPTPYGNVPPVSRSAVVDTEMSQSSTFVTTAPFDDGQTIIAVGDLGEYVYSTTGAGSGDFTGSGTGVVVTPVQGASSAGLVILPYFDSSVTSIATTDPSLVTGFENAVTAAIDYYEALISTPVTLSIVFSLGEILGVAMPSDGLGESESVGGLFSYNTTSTLISHGHTTISTSLSPALLALNNHATAFGASSLPTTDPITSAPQIFLTFAQEQALGLDSGTPLDGYVALSDTFPFTFDPNNRSVSGDYDAIGVLEHEITEVMGRLALYTTSYASAMDLFRYTSKGTIAQTNGPAYFTMNKGTTELAAFNDGGNGGDPGDWADSGTLAVAEDSYDAFSGPGTAETVSAIDLKTLDAIGYSVVTCFAAGTRILTANGEVPVEALAAGDVLPTRFAGMAAIKWIGHRTVDCRRHPRRRLVAPIRVKAGAFGPGQPSRDLYLSPDHAVAMDDVLVPIRLLVNGASIVQDMTIPVVRYFHIELDRHDLVMAEGLATESYLDTGNRGVFANGGGPVTLHPDLAASAGQVRRETESCLPLLTSAAGVEPLWHDLADWAVHKGLRLPAVETTHDPALVVVVDGQVLEPAWFVPLGGLAPGAGETGRGRYGFSIPGSARRPRLRSRCAVPSDLRPWTEDQRCLGVMVQRLEIRACMAQERIAMDDTRLRDGWWAVERDASQCWRWTDGDAELPPIDRPAVLTVTVGETLPYAVGESTAGSTFAGDVFSDLFRSVTLLAG